MEVEELFVTKSAEETQQLAKKIAKNIVPGSILLLYGDLGGGKTTFTQGLVNGLGFSNRVISPTFTISRTYSKKDGYSGIAQDQKSSGLGSSQNDNLQRIYHIDLYRLQSEKDVKTLNFEEMFSDTNAITIVEWPEKIENLVQKRENVIKLSFEHIDEGKRKIMIGVGD